MKERKGEHPLGDVGQILLTIVFLIIWVLDSFYLKKSVFLSNYVPLFIRLAISIAILVLSAIIFNDSRRIIKEKIRPLKVIEDGAFKFVRHPLYLSSILFFVSLTIFSLSLLSALTLIVIFLFYDYIGSFEEKVMEKKFAEKYLEYKRRTGKWLPKF